LFFLQHATALIIKATERTVPTKIAGNSSPADAVNNFWGPNDTRPSNPTIIDMVYPVLLRHQTSGIDKTAKLRLAAIKGPLLLEDEVGLEPKENPTKRR
jgi:hypothetical protein